MKKIFETTGIVAAISIGVIFGYITGFMAATKEARKRLDKYHMEPIFG